VRIVVVERKRHNRRAAINIMWEGNLLELLVPEVVRIGGGFNMKLATNSSATPVKKYRIGSSMESSSYTISCNDVEEDILVNLANTINVMKTRFDCLIPRVIYNLNFPSCICEIEDTEKATIGSWQYISDNYFNKINSCKVSGEDLMNSKEFIVKGLETEVWKIDGVDKKDEGNKDKKGPNSNDSLPAWLIQERQAAIDSHNSLKQIKNQCESCLNHGNETLKAAVDKLLTGSCTLQEFEEQTTQMVLNHLSPSDEDSHCSDVEGGEGKTKKKWGKSVRRQMRSFAANSGTTINNFTKLVSRSATTSTKKGTGFNIQDDSSLSHLLKISAHEGDSDLHNDEVNDEQSYSTCSSIAKVGGVKDAVDNKPSNTSSTISKGIALTALERTADDEGKSSVIMKEVTLCSAASMVPFSSSTVNPATLSQLSEPSAERPQSIRKRSSFYAEVNPMKARKMKLLPPDSKAVPSPTIETSPPPVTHSVSEVNFEEIYLSSQVVNGVASTPPALPYAVQSVDAVAIHSSSTPLNSAELSVLLLNERINRLENIILHSLRTDHQTINTHHNNRIVIPAAVGVAPEGTNSMSGELGVSNSSSSSVEQHLQMHHIEDDIPPNQSEDSWRRTSADRH